MRAAVATLTVARGRGVVVPLSRSWSPQPERRASAAALARVDTFHRTPYVHTSCSSRIFPLRIGSANVHLAIKDATALRPGDWGGDFSKVFKILRYLLKPPSHTSMPRLGMPREPGAHVGGRNLSPCGPKRDFRPASAEFVVSHHYKMAPPPRHPRTAMLARSCRTQTLGMGRHSYDRTRQA